MLLDAFRLDGRVAIVTGAGRGIGAAIAQGLAEAGADVVLAARTREELAVVADKIEEVGRKAISVVVDLAIDDPAVLVARALDGFGRLDALVNNVGGADPLPLLDTTRADLTAAFDFNVGTAHGLTVAAVPYLRESPGGGSIVNISSMMGRVPGRGFAAYGTAKAASAHYTRIAAEDLNPLIRVNGIAPGAIATSALSSVAADETARNHIERQTPLRRLGQPADIAAAALYLVSSASSYVTGKILEVDGGLVSPNFAMAFDDV